MRICMVTSVPVPPGEGLGYYVWNLSRFLVKEGHEVQIITRGERGRPPSELLEGIPIWRPRFFHTYPFHVQLHGLFVQRLVHRLDRDVDLFHLHTPLPPPLRTVRPQLLTVHTPMKGEARAIPAKAFRSLLVRAQIPVSVRLERRMLGRAARIAVVARSVAEELGGYGIDPEQVAVLGNGVDTGLFCPPGQSQATRSPDSFVFAAGRLDLRKGFEDLIEAMPYVTSAYPAVSLFVAGAGPLEGSLRARAERLGLGRAVRFLGHVERDQMIALYRDATVFAHPAHYEGLPTVLLEAMACGRAVVSTAVSGALDVLESGVNGLLVPARSPQALAAAITRLLGDAELRARVQVAARRTVEERFSWQVVGAAYLRCYQTLLEATGS